MKVLVAQLCPTLWDPMDCSPAGSSVHGIIQQENWSRKPFPSPGNLSTLGSNLGLLQGRQILYHLSHQGSFQKPYLNTCLLMWILHLGGPKSMQENIFLYKPICTILNSEASKLIYSHFLGIKFFFLLGLCSRFFLKWLLRGPIFMWDSQYKFVPNSVWTQYQFLMLIQQQIPYSFISRKSFSSRWSIKPQ